MDIVQLIGLAHVPLIKQQENEKEEEEEWKKEEYDQRDSNYTC